AARSRGLHARGGGRDDRPRDGHAAGAAPSGATTVDQGTEFMNEHQSSDERLDELKAALPREVAPPPELWIAIRAELAERSSNARRWDRWRLAAAGLLIAASSSLLTVVALRSREHAR